MSAAMTITFALWVFAAAAVRIELAGADCAVKDAHPVFEAKVVPPDGLREARLYFRSALEKDAYYVLMAPDEAADRAGDRSTLQARLPKPRLEGRTLTLHVEALFADGSGIRSESLKVRVVGDRRECREHGVIAGVAKEGEVDIYAAGGPLDRPSGWRGVGKVRRPLLAATSQVQPARPTREARPMPPARIPDVQGSASDLPPAFAPAKVVFQAVTAEQQAADYQIGPEDVLKITVYGHEDLTQVVVVQSDGSFTFPLLGRVVASGTSPDALAVRMTEGLARGFVRNPQVSVVVQEYRSKTVFVVGEVAKPGSYAIQGTMTLVEVLAKAAPTTSAGSEVVIVRPRVAAKGPVLPDDAAVAGFDGATLASQLDADVLKVNTRDIQLGRLDRNIALVAGDTVFVTQAGKVYVLGEVRNPGAYTYQPGLTVRQAISLAGGYTADAATGKVRIIRDTSRRAKDEIKVELDAAVQAGDTVIVKAKLF